MDEPEENSAFPWWPGKPGGAAIGISQTRDAPRGAPDKYRPPTPQDQLEGQLGV